MLMRLWSVVSLLLFRPIYAYNPFSNADASGLPQPCADAIRANVSCSRVAFSFRYNDFYKEATLKSTCTLDCSESLHTWHDHVKASCDGITVPDVYKTPTPVETIAGMFVFNYDDACLTIGNEYCNVVLGPPPTVNKTGGNAVRREAYNSEEPQPLPGLEHPPSYADMLEAKSVTSMETSTSPAETGSAPAGTGASIPMKSGGPTSITQLAAGGPTSSSLPCNKCMLRKLQHVADSNYYNGPKMRSEHKYESYTSACGYRSASLSVMQSSTGSVSMTNTNLPSSTPIPPCKGKSYTIKPGDSCVSISESQGIGTTWLISDNNLNAYCAQFPTSGTLCIANTCATHKLAQSDTCASIASQYKITDVQLKAWNPVINSGCYNLGKSLGELICVSQPGQEYVPPSVTPSLTTVTAPVPVPTDVANGTTKRCGKYYEVTKGDSCNTMLVKFKLSLRDFRFLNRDINTNCTNLFVGESYCIQAVGDINTYPGGPGYFPTQEAPAWSSFPVATDTPNIVSNNAVPAPRTIKPCNTLVRGASLHYGQDGINDCVIASQMYRVSVQDLERWNPSLGDPTHASCEFLPNLQYCLKAE